MPPCTVNATSDTKRAEATTSTRWSHGTIRDKWEELAGRRAGWDNPTSDQRKHGDVLSIEFEGGAIVVAPGQPVDLRQRRD
jgi:uncharacterized protein with LGFP repeats